MSPDRRSSSRRAGRAPRSLRRRMWRAARLEADFYEEVEAEPEALAQAFAVVLLTASASAAGSLIADLGYAPAATAANAAFRAGVHFLTPIVTWLAGSAFAYMVGATFFRGPETESDYAELLRTVGFAFAPGILLILTCAPWFWFSFGTELLANLWMLCAGVVAVRQALDFTTGRALGTFGVAYLLLFLLVWGLAALPLPL